MAEIKLEKKKPIWPWILGLIILALLIYFIAFADDDGDVDDYGDDNRIEEVMDDDMDDIDDTDDNDVNEDGMMNDGMDNDNDNDGNDNMSNISSVNELNTFLNRESEGQMSLDHEFSHKVLTMLIAATKDVAEMADVNVEADLNAADDMANHIMENPMDVDHANKIKNTSKTIVKVLKNIQSMRYPKQGSSIAELEAKANAIDVGEETLNQKRTVKDFFNSAARLLTQMTNNNG